MLVNYPISAAQDNNWVHECIYETISFIFNSLNQAIAMPEWPDILPQRHRERLKSRTAVKTLLKKVEGISAQLTAEQREKSLLLINNQNDIAGLLVGTTDPLMIEPEIRPLTDCLKLVFLEGFRLLTKTGSRDAHYRAIYDSLTVKTCPFCGYETFEAPGQKREDEDHYLLKDKYITSAANLFNLVPMGGKCNKSYKLQQDLLFKNNIRRKALNPYGTIKAEISLINTTPITLLDDKPDWNITISPDIEETRTWNEIFSIEERLKETVLSPNYEAVLREVSDFLKSLDLDHNSTDAQVLAGLERFEQYKKNNPEQGLGYLKDKVVGMLKFHFESGDPLVVALVRSALPQTEAT
ncbi:hypothetical protein EU508_02700 [Pseudoalteromonas fuliginea]|uniref:HNH endonuclease n=1 Tax=Pseudoalteromonas fuliginea TaxID=1872678 RepID=A0AB73BKN3_9GAMM|nr:hypothetical protein [Pseudoalteromonas fuliginea]KAA1164230.1 hypothetical protein EU508_02700 [Pseudoalteromonas fuliginea]